MMRIILSGYFDVGYSIGIDDYPFMQLAGQLDALRKETGLDVKFRPSNETFAFADEQPLTREPFVSNHIEHIGLDVPIGQGLRFFPDSENLTKRLLEDAVASAANSEFMGNYYQDFPSGIVQIMQAFVHEKGVERFECNLYGLGVGYFFLQTKPLSTDLAPYALWIYRCLEYACYGTYCGAGFRKAFSKAIQTIYAACDEPNSFRKITRRKIPYDFFPGFQCILMTDKPESPEQSLSILEKYDELTPFVMDDGEVHYGWAAVVIHPTNTEYVSRILELMKMMQVYYGICDGFERLFSFHISQSVRDSMDNRSHIYDAVSLNRLRTISHTVAEYTRFDALTQNISDLKLLRHFDELGGFTRKNEHMASACEIFSSIMNEKIEQSQTRREKRLNVYALALTGLTIVSVVADTISIAEFSFNKGWGMVSRVGTLILLGVLAIYFFLEGRSVFGRRSKKSPKHD
jgi:hypothetical protein